MRTRAIEDYAEGARDGRCEPSCPWPLILISPQPSETAKQIPTLPIKAHQHRVLFCLANGLAPDVADDSEVTRYAKPSWNEGS